MPTEKQKTVSGSAKEAVEYKRLVKRHNKRKLVEDVDRYRQLAVKLGADDTAILRGSDIVLDPRAYYKCFWPRCPGSSTNPWCPPDLQCLWDIAEEFVRSYEFGVAFRLKRKPADFTGPLHMQQIFAEMYARHLPKEKLEFVRNNQRWQPSEKDMQGPASISKTIERQARREGHHFAITYAAGACIMSVCARRGFGSACVALKTGRCRFPGASRPEGSAGMCIDFVTTIGKLGWDAPLVGYSAFPEDFPEDMNCYTMGFVFIE